MQAQWNRNSWCENFGRQRNNSKFQVLRKCHTERLKKLYWSGELWWKFWQLCGSIKKISKKFIVFSRCINSEVDVVAKRCWNKIKIRFSLFAGCSLMQELMMYVLKNRIISDQNFGSSFKRIPYKNGSDHFLDIH